MKTSKRSFTWRNQILPLAATLIVASIRAATAANYPTTILGDNPVAYYRLEEPNGSATVSDSTTNGFTGFVTYVTQADGITVYPRLGYPGIFTNGALFAPSTGSGQGRIDVAPVNSTLNPTLPDGTNGAPFTAELWVQANNASSSVYQVPLDDSSDFNQTNVYSGSAGWNFYQTQGSPSIWSFSIRPNPGFVNNGPTVVAGLWTHLVLTYDGTNASFYVNGTLFNTYAVPRFLAQNASAPLSIGYGPPTGQKPFDGAVDEVAVYTYALSAAQVATHYKIGTNEITFVPTPPSFTSQPSDTNAYSGVPFTFSAQALGTHPLSYQWNRVGSGSIPNATNNTYTFTPFYPADNNAQFFVTVTNIAGHTNSTTATLTVLTNSTIAYNPFSITRREGGYAAFRTGGTGAMPVSYQWHVVSNAVDELISGATGDTLWLSNIQATASGNAYYAHVTGPFDSADANPATLTVIARTSNAPVTLYSKIVMLDSPVAYWRLDETTGTNALDTAGSFDGGYSYTFASDLTFGYPTGIPHETDAAIHVTNTAILTVPYALELNPVSGPWSVEFWIQPTSLSGNYLTPISSEGNANSGVNLTGWNIYQHPADVWTWNIYNGGGGGSFTSEFVDNPIVPGQWYHMVLTDDGTNMVWYSNNRLVFSTTVKAVSFVQNGINGDPSVPGSGPLTLAVRSDGVFGQWDGGIDEVATYNYVLSPQQIQNHFLNSEHLNFAKSGGKTVLSWPLGSLLSSTKLSGPYTNVVGAASPFTNTATGSSGFYRLQLQ